MNIQKFWKQITYTASLAYILHERGITYENESIQSTAYVNESEKKIYRVTSFIRQGNICSS